MRGQPDEAERLLAPLAADTKVNPTFRVDAAVDLASILRAQGRFREAIRVLEQAQAPIQAERIREAMTLATQAMSYAELGDLANARSGSRARRSRNRPAYRHGTCFALAQVQLAQGKAGGRTRDRDGDPQGRASGRPTPTGPRTRRPPTSGGSRR